MPLPIDPWAWPDLADSQIAELSALGSHPEAPVFQYFAVRKCLALRERIEAGDGFSTLEAVYICGNAGLKMPLWLSYVFNRKYMAVVSFKAISWDAPESFGRPYPKGTNRSAKAKKRRLGLLVYRAVKEARQSTLEPPPIGKGLFEKIGKPLGLEATLTEEYYYSEKRLLEASHPHDVLLKPYVVSEATPAKIPKAAGLRKRRK